MPSTGETVALIGAGLFASEATGITNVTPIGPQEGDGGQGRPGTLPPSLGIPPELLALLQRPQGQIPPGLLAALSQPQVPPGLGGLEIDIPKFGRPNIPQIDTPDLPDVPDVPDVPDFGGGGASDIWDFLRGDRPSDGGGASGGGPRATGRPDASNPLIFALEAARGTGEAVSAGAEFIGGPGDRPSEGSIFGGIRRAGQLTGNIPGNLASAIGGGTPAGVSDSEFTPTERVVGGIFHENRFAQGALRATNQPFFPTGSDVLQGAAVSGFGEGLRNVVGGASAQEPTTKDRSVAVTGQGQERHRTSRDTGGNADSQTAGAIDETQVGGFDVPQLKEPDKSGGGGAFIR